MKIKVPDFSFYLAYLLILFNGFISNTDFVKVIPGILEFLTPLYFISWLLLALAFFFNGKISSYKIVAIIIFLPILSLVSLKSGHFQALFTLFLLIITVSNVNLNSVFKLHCYFLVIMMFAVAVSFKLGILPQRLVFRGTTVRYFLGYDYTSFFLNYLFHLICIGIFVFRDKIPYLVIFILAYINNVGYQLTDTKSAYYLSLCALILWFFYKMFRNHVIMERIDSLSPIIESLSVMLACGTIVFLSYFYNGSFIFTYLDRILTNRLSLSKAAIDLYGIHLWGNRVEWYFGTDFTSTYLFVDSSFVNILINYGVVFLVCICIAYFILAKKNIYSDRYYILGLVLIVVHSMFDPQFLLISYNPFILFLGLVFEKSMYHSKELVDKVAKTST